MNSIFSNTNCMDCCMNDQNDFNGAFDGMCDFNSFNDSSTQFCTNSNNNNNSNGFSNRTLLDADTDPLCPLVYDFNEICKAFNRQSSKPKTNSFENCCFSPSAFKPFKKQSPTMCLQMCEQPKYVCSVNQPSYCQSINVNPPQVNFFLQPEKPSLPALPPPPAPKAPSPPKLPVNDTLFKPIAPPQAPPPPPPQPTVAIPKQQPTQFYRPNANPCGPQFNVSLNVCHQSRPVYKRKCPPRCQPFLYNCCPPVVLPQMCLKSLSRRQFACQRKKILNLPPMECYLREIDRC